MNAGVTHLLVLSSGLVGIGMLGLLTRRDGVGVLASLQIMVAGVALALVGFDRFGENPSRPLSGMVLALVALVVAVAQLAVGAALLLLARRRLGRGAGVDGLED